MYDIKNLNIWKKEEDNRSKDEYLKDDIAELNLSVRSYNCLRRSGCSTIGDILRLIGEDENGLRKIRNLGSRSEKEILESVQKYKEQFHGSETSSEETPIVRRALIRPAKKIWDSDIEEFYLSDYALARLKQHGINKVKDLYATNPKNEPGWYAVRELFEKIPLTST